MKMELRVQNAELRSNDNGTLTVSGYVNKTEQLSNVLGSTKRFVEKIAKGVFQRAISNASRDIDFLAEHDNKKILASTRNKSLVLNEDSQGLYMTATITPTTYGKDYYELINSGIFRNMSFGFRTIRDSWKATASGIHERTIEEMELFEVSVVRDPAYSQSTIAARGIDLVEEVEIPTNLSIKKTESSVNKNEERKNNMKTEHTYGLQHRDEAEETRTLEAKAFNNYIKEERAEGLQMVGAGQAMIPETVADLIVKKLEETSPVFARARKFPSVAGTLRIAKETGTGAGAFVGEGESLLEDVISLGHVDLGQKRVGAYIALTQQLINDAATDMVKYVTDVLSRKTFKAVEKSILRGTATDEFKGIVPDASVPSITFGTDDFLIEKLLDLHLSVLPEFHDGSMYVMSRPFFNKVAQLKDGANHPYLQNGVVNGRPTYTLFGAEVVISDALDAGDVAGQVPIVFGNIELGYAVMIKKGPTLMKVQDTEHALRGSVGFLFDSYMDGVVYNEQALAKLTIV